MAEALLTTAEVAGLLRVRPKDVHRLPRKGLPGRRVGSERRFEREDVLAWAGAALRGGAVGPLHAEAKAAGYDVAGAGDVRYDA